MAITKTPDQYQEFFFLLSFYRCFWQVFVGCFSNGLLWYFLFYTVMIRLVRM